MKKIILTIASILMIISVNAQIQRLSGPRVGLTFIAPGSSADFLHKGSAFVDNDNENKLGETGPATITQYGWQWESRFADGSGDIIGIVEWIALVGGMEQGQFLPSMSSIIGVRTSNGFEVGVGPNLSLMGFESYKSGEYDNPLFPTPVVGLGMIFAIGKNFKSGDLNLPVNLVFMPGKSYTQTIGGVENEYSSGARISIMVGFNLGK